MSAPRQGRQLVKPHFADYGRYFTTFFVLATILEKFLWMEGCVLNNFFPVSRDLQKHWLWEEKPFSKGQAWIDLLMLANYEDSKKPYRGEIITYKRGDVNLSMSEIAVRWGWDRKSVRRFLKLLESDGMVYVNATTHRTTVTIVNYDCFNGSCPTNDTINSQPVPNQCPTSAHNKERKEGKEGEEREELYTDCSVFVVSDKSDTTKTPQSVRQTEVRRAADAWNSLSDCGIKPVFRIAKGTKRHAMLMCRIREYGIDEVIKAIGEIRKSSFLQGNSKKGWVIDFDWFVRPNNFIKVLEGKYDDKPDNASESLDSIHDSCGEDFPGYIQL